MPLLTNLGFENSYARLPSAFHEVVDPTPLPDPYLVAFSPEAAGLLDLDPSEGSNPELPKYLSGNLRLPGAEPIAQAYAGHQFGVWVPQLGDGRAFLLGEVRNARGERWDLHLKGAGRTRFSRFGDGRSVLRSAVREYLASEALYGLGIPTTRALSIVGSQLPVQREATETAATLLRLSPSHVRFGTFEYFAARGQVDRLSELADYVITRNFPDLDPSGPRDDTLREFFGEVCRRTARLMAQWMAAGFAHGVMNTDNMSVLGLTLDYGPYGFLDDYDAGFVCNHTDTGGRYAFDRQPGVGRWNCGRFGEALLLIASGRKDSGETPDDWQEALETYWPAFETEYSRLMGRKLGLAAQRGDDADLVRDLLELLQADRTDYTGFFRALSDFPNIESFRARNDPAWLDRYAARLVAEGSVDAERTARMRRVNPRYVLRNWIAQEAIERAERRDFALIEELRVLFANPFVEHPSMERYAAPPPAAARELAISCSS